MNLYRIALILLFISTTMYADSPPPVYKSSPPIVKTGTTFSIPAASGSVDGYLSSSNFNIFNNKATLPSQSGQSGKFLTTDGSVTSWATASGGGGSVTGVTASSPLFSSGGTAPNITCQSASGSLAGCLSSIDWTTFNSKEPAITAGSSSQYYRGDKTFQTLDTLVVPENTNLYFTTGRAAAAAPVQSVAGRTGAITLTTADVTGNLAGDIGGPLSATLIGAGAVTDAKASLANKPAVAAVATTNQTLSGFPIIDGFQTAANSLVLLTAQTTASQNGPWSAQSGAWVRPTWYPTGGTTQAFQFITTLVRLGSTYSGTVWRLTTSGAVTIDTTPTTWVITKITLNATTATKATNTTDGFLSSTDWTTFNNKLDASRFNYITNPDAEINTAGWNLYDNSGRVASAYVTNQDITWSSVATDNTGNGINIRYDFHATQPSSTPLVTVVSPTLITVAWYNGPTLANNPTATQLKAAFDAVPGAVALATCTISGTAGNRQYIDGSHVTANGGDTAPSNGTGGTPSNLTLTRTTSAPLVGIASFLESKGASSQLGMGSSTDFSINNADQGNILQLSFYYNADAGMTLGSASDKKFFLYDITNNVMLPLTRQTLTGPTAGTTYRFAAQFTASSNSLNYRLIGHTATANATAWNLKFDSVTVSPVLDAATATQVPSVVLLAQPITGAVTDHMAVMWQDGNTAWRPATMAAGADSTTLFGFATNIVGLTANITLRGALNGFSFGPFLGYNQYVDSAVSGGLSPSPATFTDTYVVMGKGIASDTIMVEPKVFNRLVTSKGGLLTNAGANNGTGDQVLAGGSTGNVLAANTGVSLGLNWVPAVVAAAPFTYTTATRTLTIATSTDSVAGVMSAADHTILSGHTTTLALKAPLASPVFTGDVNSSTGNVLASTIGKGLQVKTGTNAKIGTAVLVAGTVTVANTSVTANSRIFLSSNTDGGTPGWLRVSAKTNGTSFVITSSSATDTSTVAWHIVESIP